MSGAGVERTAEDWIAALELTPGAAGGYFRQAHRAPAPGGAAPSITVIHALLTGTAPRARMHRARGDGLYFHHAGGTLRIHTVGPAGDYVAHVLGPGQPQCAVAGGRWKALELAAGPWALISEAVVPGWTPEGFELAAASVLETLAPALRELLGPFVGAGP